MWKAGRSVESLEKRRKQQNARAAQRRVEVCQVSLLQAQLQESQAKLDALQQACERNAAELALLTAKLVACELSKVWKVGK